MTESNRLPSKFKGVVLVMVVTVMFILMIMLLATLSVVSSTTRRTLTKFEENQAYYTSRSVLDVYIDEYLEDAAEPNSPSQALADACDDFGSLGFSDIATSSFTMEDGSCTDFSGEPISLGFVHQQEILSMLYPKYRFKTDSLATAGSSTISDDVNWELNDTAVNDNSYFVEFEAKVPDLSGVANASDNYMGKFDTDDTVIVRIELLRVLYPNKDKSDFTDLSSGSQNTRAEARGSGNLMSINDIDWASTYYRIKVSAYATVGDGAVNDDGMRENESEVTVSVILEPSVTISPAGFNNAMTSTAATDVSNHSFTIGGASAMTEPPANHFFFGNETTLCGKYVYDTPLVYMNSYMQHWYQDKNTHFVVENGCLSSQNGFVVSGYGPKTSSAMTQEDFDKRPFVVANGIYGYKGKVGTNTGYCDLILSAGEDADHQLRRTNKDGGAVPIPGCLTNATDQENYLSKVVLCGDQFECFGDIYANGDIYLSDQNGVKIHGNIYCTGTIYFNDNAVNNNQIVVDSGYSIYAQEIKKAYSGEAVDNTKIPAYAGTTGISDFKFKWGDLNEYNDDWTKKVSLGVGRNEVTFTTRRAVMSSYIYKTTETEKAAADGKNVGDPYSATRMLKNDINSELASLQVSGGATQLKPSLGTTITADQGSYNSDTDFYEFILNTSNYQNDSGTYYIDTEEGNVQIQVTGTMDSASPKFIIKGDRSVAVTIKDNDYVSVRGLSFVTEQIDQMANNGDVFYVGDPSLCEDVANHKDKPKAPNINFYVGDGATLECRNGNGIFMSCYLYGAYAKFSANTNSGRQLNYSFNDSATRTVNYISVVGSMVFQTIDSQNEIGVLFVQPSGGAPSGGAGGRVHWGRQKYLNRG